MLVGMVEMETVMDPGIVDVAETEGVTDVTEMVTVTEGDVTVHLLAPVLVQKRQIPMSRLILNLMALVQHIGIIRKMSMQQWLMSGRTGNFLNLLEMVAQASKLKPG